MRGWELIWGSGGVWPGHIGRMVCRFVGEPWAAMLRGMGCGIGGVWACMPAGCRLCVCVCWVSAPVACQGSAPGEMQWSHCLKPGTAEALGIRAPAMRHATAVQVFEDSFHQLRNKDMRGKLVVHFQNEEGIDAGGVSREWFQVPPPPRHPAMFWGGV